MTAKAGWSGSLVAVGVTAAVAASLLGAGDGPRETRAAESATAMETTAFESTRSVKSTRTGESRTSVESGMAEAQVQTAGAEALLRGLTGTSPLACELVLRALGNRWGSSSVSPRVHPPLAGTASERATARWAWSERPDAADAAALLAGVEADDPCVQRVAARLLGVLDDPGVVSRLIDRAGAGSGRSRLAAIAALGHISDDRASAALEALLDDGDPRVQRAAAWALAESGDDDSVAGLGDALGSSDAMLSENAAWALGKIERRSAIGPLEAALLDSRTGVRVNAAWALGSIEDAAAIPSLAAVVGSDAVDEVRRTAAWALGRIEK